jgi:Acetamidase/Formamidase family
MCFAHSGTASEALHVQAEISPDAVVALGQLAASGSLGTVDVSRSGTPEAVVAPAGDRVLDGYSRVMHNRWNRDLDAAITVQPGEEVQLLCRDALDIGDQAKTMTAEGTMTIDLGRIHPLTGPIHIEGAPT